MTSRLFVYAVCGDEHVARVNLSLRFLKRFTRLPILVVTTRASAAVEHDQTVAVEVPAERTNREAAVLLKSGLHRVAAAERCCYLDSDVIAVHPEIDSIFAVSDAPVVFGHDHVGLRAFSPYAVRCGCGEPCDHLRQAIEAKFGVTVDADWPHWNSGLFVFGPDAAPLMELWNAFAIAGLADPYWEARDQGTLIAAAWKLGLQGLATLPPRYHRIVDRYFGVPLSRRAKLRVGQYNVDEEYALTDGAGWPRPYFLHFVGGGIGARGWKNWDDVEALL